MAEFLATLTYLLSAMGLKILTGNFKSTWW